jgi:hypothetical protein
MSKATGVPLGALFQPYQFTNFSTNDALTLISNASSIPASFAAVLGPLLPSNASVSQASKVMCCCSVNIINNAAPADLVNNLNNTPLAEINTARVALMATKVISHLDTLQVFHRV